MENVMTLAGTPAEMKNKSRPTDNQHERSWQELDRQDWHLWLLAIMLMFVLGLSLLTFMFPTAFWFGEELALKAPQRAFLGFGVLLALALVYLVQRQTTMRRLKRQLFEARVAVFEAERKTKLQAMASLPGLGHFRDGLAMEYRRAASSGSRLAMIVLGVHHASPEEMGEVSGFVRQILRRGETLARLSESALGIILPDMRHSDAVALCTQIQGVFRSKLPRDIDSVVTAFPEEVSSLSALEAPLRGMMD